jgi:DnaJ-class molecular chaperone
MKVVGSKTSTDYCLCHNCSGSGKQSERRSAYESEDIKCGICDGHGRLKVVTETKLYQIQK